MKEEKLKEQITEEVRSFPRAAKKKLGKRTHDLGLRMRAAITKIHKLNYKGWLKR